MDTHERCHTYLSLPPGSREVALFALPSTPNTWRVVRIIDWAKIATNLAAAARDLLPSEGRFWNWTRRDSGTVVVYVRKLGKSGYGIAPTAWASLSKKIEEHSLLSSLTQAIGDGDSRLSAAMRQR